MRVLITGATGLVGARITELCHAEAIPVSYLTTSKEKIVNETNYQGYYWNPSNGEIDSSCLEGVGAVIHLAGANIFRRWTDANKKKLYASRIQSAGLLHKTLSENENQVGQFISASGVSIYPSSYDKMHYEEETAVDDSFLGHLAEAWERAADSFKSLEIRVAKIRTGIVLAKDGGALPQMQRPVKYGLGAALGNGKQWQSWIHITDLARMYIHVLQKGLEGVYNGAAPNPVRNEELMQEIAANMDKKIRLPKVPAFAMKLAMGEMAEMVLSSQLVASKKIEETGFTFYYINLTRALQDLKAKEDE